MIKNTKTPLSLREAIGSLNNPNRIVLYYAKDGGIFMLSPFGGGVSKTGEHELAHGWKLTEDKLENIIIIY